ncbi:Cytochrome P450 86B1 [Triticum urartu]|uniref:Cytochrome P450 86B1 n=1 Tax=Triticum urartu TaxID=4572 RepID=M8A2N5_TRIUA|nr:Cytochrome P450 86B1 [Triticum urartu]
MDRPENDGNRQNQSGGDERFRRWDGLPTSWPVIGVLPALCVNTGRMHDWLTELLHAAGMSYVMRRRWGLPVDVLVTADPANVAHVLSANFDNYPKGARYNTVFSVLGDGIFNADGESWSFQRRKAHALLSDAGFRAAVAANTAGKLDEGLVPLLDGLATSGTTVDLQDVFMRLTFDLTAMFVFGIDPGCLAADFPHVPFAAAIDDTEEVLVYRYVTPVPWVKLQSYLNIGHRQKMSKARRVLDASIAELVSLRRQRAANSTCEAGTDLLTSYMACQAEGRCRHEPSHKFVAFNMRPRTCLGKDLAYAQMKAVVAAVVPRFQLEVAAGAAARPKPKLSPILHMKDGLEAPQNEPRVDYSLLIMVATGMMKMATDD